MDDYFDKDKFTGGGQGKTPPPPRPPQRPPQQDGAQEHGQLLRYVVAQLHQPNSRRKSPPCPPEEKIF